MVFRNLVAAEYIGTAGPTRGLIKRLPMSLSN